MSKSDFIVYNQEGAILRSGSCPTEAVVVQAGPGETAVIYTLPPVGEFFVDTESEKSPEVKSKTPLPVSVGDTRVKADARALAAFSGIPEGTRVSCEELDLYRELVTSVTLRVSFDLPIDYKFFFTNPRYTQTEIIVHAY
jgi:hypothetical protein